MYKTDGKENHTSYCEVKISRLLLFPVWLFLTDSSLTTVMSSTLHPGLRSPSPPWCWCWRSPGSGCSSSTSVASESLQQNTDVQKSTLFHFNVHVCGVTDYFLECKCLTADDFDRDLCSFKCCFVLWNVMFDPEGHHSYYRWQLSH